jgi:hypothetical protein
MPRQIHDLSKAPPGSVAGERSKSDGDELTRAIAGEGVAPATEQPATGDTGNRHALISRSAYYRAEKRGFAAGSEVDDWIAAEKEFDERSGAGTVG